MTDQSFTFSFTFSFTLNHLSFTIYLYVPSARQALGRGRHRYFGADLQLADLEIPLSKTTPWAMAEKLWRKNRWRTSQSLI